MPNEQKNPFLTLSAGTSADLAADGSFAMAGHLWSQPEIDALIFASAARRPLLVRGEAGCGKSQIARAAAHHLKTQLLYEVIHPRFEALDLLYRFDAIARLADAQHQGIDPDSKKYNQEGKLWQAMEVSRKQNKPAVLLIDEIDKADADVPNALLDVLGNRSFQVPHLIDEKTKQVRIVSADPDHMPLMIITTNEERELPAAFVRRCAVLNLSPPKEDGDTRAFEVWLVQRGSVHRHLVVDDDVRREAARQVVADRKAAQSVGYSKVGLAEYMDLLTALHELTKNETPKSRGSEQRKLLKRLSAYALVKHADQDQMRKSVDATPVGEGK